jgi:hypothetical protein
MEARRLIGNAAFGPETLKIVGLAFDEAWATVERRFSHSPQATEAARLSLASIVLRLVKEGDSDPATLRGAALQIFAVASRR